MKTMRLILMLAVLACLSRTAFAGGPQCQLSISGVSANPNVLTPPDHKMIPVTIAYTAATLFCFLPHCSLTVSSNQSPNGEGDGNTGPDYQVIDAHNVLLRAERAGGDGDRIYTVGIHCSASGAGGGASRNASVTVTVPHDASN